MSKFTIRIELHGAEENDYMKHHDLMTKEGFSRTIKLNGIVYQLPTAEYNFSTPEDDDFTAKDVLAKARKAATGTKKAFGLLVTESFGPRSVYGLKEIK